MPSLVGLAFLEVTHDASEIGMQVLLHDSNSIRAEWRSPLSFCWGNYSRHNCAIEGRKKSCGTRKRFLDCLVCIKSAFGDDHLVASSLTRSHRSPDELAKCGGA